jgi:hypothetical protein
MTHEFTLKDLKPGILKSGRAARDAARILFDYRPLSKKEEKEDLAQKPLLFIHLDIK